jgi:hypothetical protein
MPDRQGLQAASLQGTLKGSKSKALSLSQVMADFDVMAERGGERRRGEERRGGEGIAAHR